MRRGRATWLGAAFAVAVACGGSVEGGLDGGGSGGDATGGFGGTVAGSGGSGGTAGTAGTAGTGAAGTGGTAGTAGTAGSGGRDAGPDVWVDPPCPDAAPPPPTRECEPFQQPTGCGPGEGCYPFVDYPGNRCEPERFGTMCVPAGTGVQGDSCEFATACAAGFVCVITGQRTQCVRLCPLEGEDGCPRGLICVPVDVEGFGGCF